MVDNTQLNSGTGGDLISTDDIGGGVKVQRIKVQYGVDGSATDVSDTNPMPVDDAGGSLTVDGTVTADAGAGTFTVDGSGVTQPVSAASLPLPTGAATAANQLADGHNVTVDNAAGASAVNIQDGGNTITVDGTVTANAGTGTFSVQEATALDCSGATVTVDLGSNNDVTIEGGAVLGTDGNAGPANALSIGGTESGGNFQEIQVDSDGHLQVDVLSGGGGGTQYTDDTDNLTPATTIGTVMLAANTSDSVDAGNLGALAMSLDRRLHVDADITTQTLANLQVQSNSANLATEATLADVETNTDFGAVVGGGLEATALRVTLASDSTGQITVDGTVTANAGTGTFTVDGSGVTQPISAASLPLPTGAATAANQLANGHDVTVDNAAGGSAVNIQDGGNEITVDQATAANLNAQVQGPAAHDAATSGNPVLLGGQMETMADSAPGTRSGTDGDATKLATTDGALFVAGAGPQSWDYHLDTSSAQTDTSIHAAPGAGLSLYVTDIVFSSGAATAINIFFEEGATTVLGPYYLEAVAGRGLALHFRTPKKITANTALTYTTSAAIAQSIDVMGFIAPG